MKKSLQLEDLTCPSCVMKIEKALGSTKGITHVNVRFNASKVDVEFEPETVAIEDIKQTIENVGFEVIG